MKLTPMKYKPQRYHRQLTSFGGLNLMDTAKEGELSACTNMASDCYPFLAPRKNRATTYDLTNGTALTSYNGLVYVDGTTLYYNDTAVGTVAEGLKSFAQLNTKLVIWPDKKYLDLTTKEFKSLDVSLTKSSSTATFGTDTLTMDVSPSVNAETANITYDTTVPTVKVYSSVSWNSSTGWTRTDATEKLATAIAAGDKIIPTKVESSGAYVIGTKSDGAYPDENNDGVYYTVTNNSSGPNYHYRWKNTTFL